jgi:hypothetical protein
VDLVAVVTTVLPSGGVLGVVALVSILIFVLIISLKSDDPPRSAAMLLLALRGRAHPGLGPDDVRKPNATVDEPEAPRDPPPARRPRRRRRRRQPPRES